MRREGFGSLRGKLEGGVWRDRRREDNREEHSSPLLLHKDPNSQTEQELDFWIPCYDQQNSPSCALTLHTAGGSWVRECIWKKGQRIKGRKIPSLYRKEVSTDILVQQIQQPSALHK